MAFLLGLFIGATIFILGYGFGLVRGGDDDVDGEDEESSNGVIYCVFPSFDVFVDEVLDCRDKGVPLNITVTTQSGEKSIVITDQRMHVEQSYNIDSEG